MSITINKFEPKQALKISHRKENKLDKAFIGIDKQGKELFNLRMYFPGQTCYACLWVFCGNSHATGSGSAGGYGYEKRSAAADSAFRNAGIDCTRFHGTGETYEACVALGKYLAGDEFLTVVEAYG